MDLRFTGLREADGEGKDEKEGENGDDPLERVEFSLRGSPRAELQTRRRAQM